MRFAWLIPLLLPACGDSAWTAVTSALLPSATEPAAEPVVAPTGRVLRLGIGRRTVDAALLQEAGARRLWRAGSGLVVATDGARVVATSGLPEVLAATHFDGPDPLARPLALVDAPAEARRLVDLMRADRTPEGMRFGVALRCVLRAEATERAEVLLVRERCMAGREGSFENRFWVAADSGTVQRAEQWVGPGLGLLTIEYPEADPS